MAPATKGAKVWEEDDDWESNLPEMITDTANVILDAKFPGIYISKSTELIRSRKKRVAGYGGLKNDTEFHGFYNRDEIKAFCLAYDRLVFTNYGLTKDVKDKNGNNAWQPTGTVKSIFWRAHVPTLHLDHEWITKMQGKDIGSFPLKDDELPNWLTLTGDKKEDKL